MSYLDTEYTPVISSAEHSRIGSTSQPWIAMVANVLLHSSL